MRIKGGGIRDFVPVHREARKVRDACLEAREDTAAPLFITRPGRRILRGEAAESVHRITAQANGRLSNNEIFDVSPGYPLKPGHLLPSMA